MDDENVFIGLLLSCAALGAAWWYLRQSDQPLALPDLFSGSGSTEPVDSPIFSSSADTSTNNDTGGGWVADTAQAVEKAMGWTTPAKGQIYESVFQAATSMYGLPEGLLSRVAYQESRYNKDAVSPVGAIGLMQFMPATAAGMGFDPKDPVASIWGAAKYLKQLYTQFGDWQKALAAYNWGPGNVSRKGLDKAPTETRNYFSEILGDLGLDTIFS